MTPLIRLAALATLMVALTGCFTSKVNLITAETADYPIADGTKFLRTTPGDPNDFPAHVVVRRDGANYVLDSDGEDIVGMLQEVAPHTYLGVMSAEGSHLYNLYVYDQKGYLQYTLMCDAFEKLLQEKGRTLSEFGATKVETNCQFATIEDLTKAALYAVESGFKAEKRFDPER